MKNLGKLALNIMTVGAILLVLLWTLYPLMWIFLSSLKPAGAQFQDPPVWFNFEPTLDNYREFFGNSEFISAILNSLLITIVSVLFSLILGTPTAYSLARFKYRHDDKMLIFVLLSRMTPPIVLVMPLFLLARALGIIDTYLVLIIMGGLLSVPFVIWMMRGFFADLPIELEEAAMIDGCDRKNVLVRVLLPLVAPGLAATAVLCSLLVWNQFLFVLVLGGSSTRTLPVLVKMFVTEQSVNWGVMSAAGIITVLPLIIFGLLAQKYLVKGLTMGGVKE